MPNAMITNVDGGESKMPKPPSRDADGLVKQHSMTMIALSSNAQRSTRNLLGGRQQTANDSEILGAYQ